MFILSTEEKRKICTKICNIILRTLHVLNIFVNIDCFRSLVNTGSLYMEVPEMKPIICNYAVSRELNISVTVHIFIKGF
jgi:hypothetical protein